MTLPWVAQTLLMSFDSYSGFGAYSGNAGLGLGGSALARVCQILARVFQAGAVVSVATTGAFIFPIFRSRWLVDKVAPFPKPGACPRCRNDNGTAPGGTCPECRFPLSEQAPGERTLESGTADA